MSVFICFLVSSFAIFSCAGGSEHSSAEDPFRVFAEKYRLEAADHESQGHLQKALFSWKVVSAFTPGHPEVSDAILRLNDRIGRESETHFQKGLQHFQAGRIAAARKEFLLALMVNPEHHEAFDFLKHRLKPKDELVYVTREGDSPAKIAETVYKDPGLERLVAYFSGLDEKDAIGPGLTLHLPLVDTSPVVGRPYPAREERKPDPLPRSGKHGDTIGTSACMLSEISAQTESQRLTDGARYHLGVDFFQKKRYRQAREIFEDLGEDYKNVRQMLAYIRKYSESMAEFHYRKGVVLFLSSHVGHAVREWEEALNFNPEHSKARKDLEKAMKLFLLRETECR